MLIFVNFHANYSTLGAETASRGRVNVRRLRLSPYLQFRFSVLRFCQKMLSSTSVWRNYISFWRVCSPDLWCDPFSGCNNIDTTLDREKCLLKISYLRKHISSKAKKRNFLSLLSNEKWRAGEGKKYHKSILLLSISRDQIFIKSMGREKREEGKFHD